MRAALISVKLVCYFGDGWCCTSSSGERHAVRESGSLSRPKENAWEESISCPSLSIGEASGSGLNGVDKLGQLSATRRINQRKTNSQECPKLAR